MFGQRLILGSAAAATVWISSWAVMVILARRLPLGLLREVAAFLRLCDRGPAPAEAPGVRRRAKVALLAAVLWVLPPIDLLPEFLPVIGPLDDVVAVVLLLRYAARTIPRPLLLEAWPEDPGLLERLLDRRPRPRAAA